jgi:branched-chain amino acid transport system ATP-binding protein
VSDGDKMGNGQQNIFTEHWMALFGPIIVLVALLGKAGIWGLMEMIDRRRALCRQHRELAMALAAQPKLLLLDEPVAGMSVQDSSAVVSLLRRLKGRYSILLIEHDMEAV